MIRKLSKEEMERIGPEYYLSSTAINNEGQLVRIDPLEESEKRKRNNQKG